jgi:hypothetical protein
MIYEGTNTCFGIAGGADNGNNFYSSVGVATSLDYGHTWPTYRAKSGFSFVPLPGENPSQGPTAPAGALGSSACIGNDCAATPPPNYGRYPVLSPSVSMSTAMALGTPLPGSMGDSEMSAFLDDAGASPAQFVYAIYDYKAGTGVLTDPKAPGTGLMIARAQLNGGTAPLNFLKWNGQAFASAGVGGYDSPIFPNGSFTNCEGPSQLNFGASISYVDVTQQYLLTFVCDSPGDPALGQVAGAPRGGAWFYSTSYDLSDPTQWTPPREIAGSWSQFDQSSGCSDFKGFYPTLMSLGGKTGHLSAAGMCFTCGDVRPATFLPASIRRAPSRLPRQVLRRRLLRRLLPRFLSRTRSFGFGITRAKFADTAASYRSLQHQRRDAFFYGDSECAVD